MNQIEAYTRFKQVPPEVSKRIKSYIEFKFQKTVFKEKLILESISNSLRNEIVWHLCQNFITRVEIFKDMPPNVMMKIVMLLKQEIYLPNDVVVQTGELGTEMFFIYVGVLAVYTPTGKEICHLTDGDHFGEIALLLNETRVASCVAIDFCELYRLTKRNFNEALESYPAAKLRILQLGQDRFKQTEKIIQATNEEQFEEELMDQ
ncbi:potassium/sodium hyperpolarization-activated cyclic nucleotide-gated channel 1-like [Harmonia axyridis]|uniref:potassium/sodium hyperpolarization-activated cyclic nucleotide-gated channel 1-like n=1 Tax=Harmonia axyridis TaxID=115357 RepID=UPI001E278710|nr:potassium/sodium hyperpolarization-activated cyclic nucleotide-gated channel 1-like [Harmonia axyridis]